MVSSKESARYWFSLLRGEVAARGMERRVGGVVKVGKKGDDGK